MSLASFVASSLNKDQVARWREFISQSPAAHYEQDPAWAEVENRGTGQQARRPHFFWCERDGSICLTALGVQRRLPIPGRVFWEFNNGPNVLEPEVLDEWLVWLLGTVGRQTSRLRIQPASRLDEVGDQIETILDARGFVRRRTAGIWSTLVVRLDRPEEEILASFRPRFRSRIRQSKGLGIVVAVENGPEGWTTLARLDREMSTRTGHRPVGATLIEAIGRHWCGDETGGAVLVARLGGEPLAAVLVITYGATAHMRMMPSSRRHNGTSTSHLLLWEAMRWAWTHGCTEFDLDGYSLCARPGEEFWGTNQFKRGFAHKVQPRKFVAVHERVFSPLVVNSAATVRRLQARRRVNGEPIGRTK